MRNFGLEDSEQRQLHDHACHYGKDLMEKCAWNLEVLKGLLARKGLEVKSHSDRLLGLVDALGRKIGLSTRELADLRLYARFHDLGKVFIPNEILFKKGPLTGKEWDVMKMHSEIGARIASSIKELDHISDYILYHHERWDGLGYPAGTAGLSIPLFCRVLLIADSWDSMINDQPHRDAMSYADAAAEIEINAGRQFDPTLVDIWRTL